MDDSIEVGPRLNFDVNKILVILTSQESTKFYSSQFMVMEPGLHGVRLGLNPRQCGGLFLWDGKGSWKNDSKKWFYINNEFNFFLILIRALTIWRILGLGATFHEFATVRKRKLHQVLPPVNIETVETYKHCKYT